MSAKPPITEKQAKSLEGLKPSDAIRRLDTWGYARADIARILGKRYQHVRNVLEGDRTAKERKTKVTVTLTTEVFSRFAETAQEIGLRRDSYLESIIPEALSALEALPANSPSTMELLSTIFRPGASSLYESGHLEKITFSLNSELVSRTNTLCESKNLPRDLFFEGVIDCANDALSHATETIHWPIQFCESIGKRFGPEFLLSDVQAEELRQEVVDELLIAEAIAQVKGIQVGVAQQSYLKLSPREKKKLREHSHIKQALRALKAKQPSSIDLADLLGTDAHV